MIGECNCGDGSCSICKYRARIAERRRESNVRPAPLRMAEAMLILKQQLDEKDSAYNSEPDPAA